jgi:Tfp pilus assembly protein PilF
MNNSLQLTLPIALALFLSVGAPHIFCAGQKQTSGSSSDAAEACAGKGNELVRDRRYREAAKEFQAALALEPHLVRVRYQLAVCWFNVGQLKQARDEFERVRKETAGGGLKTGGNSGPGVYRWLRIG